MILLSTQGTEEEERMKGGGEMASAEVLCITISIFVILSNIIGTILFEAGSIHERTGMKKAGMIVIAFATITAVLNLSWYLIHLSLSA